MNSLESFKQNYIESRNKQRDNYDCKEAFVEIDFCKKNGRYSGDDLKNLKIYIYSMIIQGKRFKDIATVVDLEISTVYYHFKTYQPPTKIK